MTDKERIRKEVERLQNELIQEKKKGFGSETDDACILELQNVLTYIDSLQEEPVSEDLEEACEQLAENARKYKAETLSPFFSPTDYKQGVIDGANWKEQQMIKDAVDGWVFRGIKDGKLRISDNKECWNGIRIPEKSIEKSYLICTTDDAIKVKVIVIKED